MKKSARLARTGVFLSLALVPVIACGEDLTKCLDGWDATQAGQHAKAVGLFRACIEEGQLDPSAMAATYRNIGIAYRRNKQPAEAVKAFDKAIALHPSDVASDYVNRGNAFDELGRREQAFADYSHALALHPGDGEALYNRGIAYEGQKAYDKARADFVAAYNNGLRSRLLYERLVMYGVIEAEGQENAASR